jgi:serine-type D-Ala-D-Ala carboxypeptidase (penicillin-binding protein 5/6)
MRAALRFTAALTACVATVAAAQVALADPAAHATAASAGPAGVVAKAGELFDLTTGKQLWSRRLQAELPIASITKVMTAMVVLAAGHLNRKIRVTQAAVNYALDNDAGSAGLHAGDVLTTRQLLHGLLLPSGADAAYLLAGSYGPGSRKFVRKMNRTAGQLGLTHTHFANFDGLPWPTETSTYSTARDVVALGEAAMKNAVFRKIVDERSYRISATRKHHKYDWTNTDLLLRRYRGALGIKTGFTLAAGYCLLFEARRQGTTLIGVVLDSTNTDTTMRFTAAARLLNWGFAKTR